MLCYRQRLVSLTLKTTNNEINDKMFWYFLVYADAFTLKKQTKLHFHYI